MRISDQNTENWGRSSFLSLFKKNNLFFCFYSQIKWQFDRMKQMIICCVFYVSLTPIWRIIENTQFWIIYRQDTVKKLTDLNQNLFYWWLFLGQFLSNLQLRTLRIGKSWSLSRAQILYIYNIINKNVFGSINCFNVSIGVYMS